MSTNEGVFVYLKGECLADKKDGRLEEKAVEKSIQCPGPWQVQLEALKIPG